MPSMQYIAYITTPPVSTQRYTKKNAGIKSQFHLDAASEKHITRSAHMSEQFSFTVSSNVFAFFFMGHSVFPLFFFPKGDLTLFWLNPQLCRSLLFGPNLSPC